MLTVVCAFDHAQAITAARDYGIPRRDLIVADNDSKLMGLTRFDVLAVTGFITRRDSFDLWALLRYRFERGRADPADGPVLPEYPPGGTVLYRAGGDPAADAVAALLRPFATGTPPSVPVDTAATVVASHLSRDGAGWPSKR
ncbi:hypothetical protein [Actinomadura sp. 3N508]|uniref:hypothetical protein n=1 Tax=Actinomadura sp. 3N508 TaxID=3375153 RepID=UPI0037BB3038